MNISSKSTEIALPKLPDLLAEFGELDDWEDRYDFLIDLGKKLPPLPAEYRTAEHVVRGCQSTVWLHATMQASEQGPRMQLYADSDSLIVKGLIVVLRAIFQGQLATSIPALDEMAVFAQMGLNQHLTPQRRNGLFAMVKRIRQLAASPE